jgi:hypothetical protein
VDKLAGRSGRASRQAAKARNRIAIELQVALPAMATLAIT